MYKVFPKRANIKRDHKKSHPGHYTVICDRCGVYRDNSEMRTEWDGFYVCTTCYEERHPLLDEGLYQTPETAYPLITRPVNPNQFVNQCTSLGVQSVPGYITAGCVICARYDGQAMINVYLAAGGV